MQDLLFSANLVLPTFVIMGLGYLAKRVKLVNQGFLNSADKLSFRMFMFIILFYNIYSTDLGTAFNGKLVIFSVVSVLVIDLFVFSLVPVFEKNNGRRGVLIQAMTRGNFILFGIQICQAAYGAEGAAAVSVLCVFFAPLINFFAVLALSLFNNEEGRMDVKKTLRSIATNPFILGALAGLIVNLSGLRFPYFFEKALGDVAKMGTTFAVFLLGAEFEMRSMQANAKAIAAASFVKLLLAPAAVLTTAYFMGFRDMDFCILIAAFASPVAVNSYVMAKLMHCDHDLAGQILVSTVIFCSFTMFLFLFIAKRLSIM